MKHLVADLFHEMMTDRPKVMGYLLRGHGWPVVKEKVYRFFPKKKNK